MGWGILFIGYFLAFFVSVPPLPLIGLALVAWALHSLADYRPGFMNAAWWLIPLGVPALFETFVLVTKVLPFLGVAMPEMAWINAVSIAVSLVRYALILAFHIVFLRHVRGFAGELELPSIAKRADWGIWLVSVQCTCLMVAMGLELVGWQLPLFSMIAYLLQFVWAIFNAINIFTCYMYICPEGDEDMERKPSRFGFVNDIRAKMEERDARARERENAYKEQKNNRKKRK